ncbi:MAG: sugar phosphate isomerase/epimerase, partial [Planctomycetaceae bacterium]|nr:sugar phosphate isomerase/epimerase [Planctomycetaceae bacterium]
MSQNPQIILSAFADEAANQKTAIEQFAVLAALGLTHYSPRFVDVTGSGAVKHVVDLDDAELGRLKELQDQYGLTVTSIGSRLGKVKLLDRED